MNKSELRASIYAKKSCLCIGLDPDLNQIPAHLLAEPDPIFAFNKAIIDATAHVAVAYKPNLAFYERYGSKGWDALEKTMAYIPTSIFKIADAKRGDIGNTSTFYAQAFFETLRADAITVAPYMGSDSIKPFLAFEQKWAIILALTSNEGANDFQLSSSGGRRLAERVIDESRYWGTDNNTMYVVGATRPEWLQQIRKQIPDHFLLIPGVGKQGGDLKTVLEIGISEGSNLLINASRSILYAGSGFNFAKAAAKEAERMQTIMATFFP